MMYLLKRMDLSGSLFLSFFFSGVKKKNGGQKVCVSEKKKRVKTVPRSCMWRIVWRVLYDVSKMISLID